MSLRRSWPLLVLVVVALAAAFWPRWPRAVTLDVAGPDAPNVSSSAREFATNKSPTGHHNPVPQVDACGEGESSPSEAFPVVPARGRIKFKGLVGIEACGWPRPGMILNVGVEDEETGKRSMATIGARRDGEICTALRQDTLPWSSPGVLRPGRWSFSQPSTNDLAETTFAMEEDWDEAMLAMAAPRFSNGVLDFGEIVVDNEKFLGEQEYYYIGHVVHVSGVVMTDGDGFRILPPQYEEPSDVEINAEGTIFGTVDMQAPSGAPWMLGFFDAASETVFAGPGQIWRVTPALNGRTFDLGRVTLDCALVDVEVTGWVSDEARLARAGKEFTKADLPPAEARVVARGYAYNHLVEVSRDKSARLFLPPGFYKIACQSYDTFSRYEDGYQSVHLKPGERVGLKLALKPARFLLAKVRTTEGSKLARARVRLARLLPRGREDDITTYEAPGPHYCVPLPMPAVSDGSDIEVTGSAEHWREATVTVPGDALVVEIVLDQRKEDINPVETKGAIVVEVELPEALRGSVQTYARRKEDDGRWSWTTLSAHWDKLEPGEYEVLVIEKRTSWGYPGGIVTGPVTAVIEREKTTRVRLPAAAPPPWKHGAGTYVALLTCAGEPMGYHGDCMGSEGVGDRDLRYNTQESGRPEPCAVLDGDASIALDLSPPQEAGAPAVFKHDFECRLEVRVMRNGRPADEPVLVCAKVDLDPKNYSEWEGWGNYEGMAWATANEGKPAMLWLPQGKAEVDLSGFDMVEKTVFVEIQKGKRAVVTVNIGTQVVALQWDERYKQERPESVPNWQDYSGADWIVVDAKGEVRSLLSHPTAKLELVPGPYVLKPLAFPAETPHLSFEVLADVPTRVEIPFVSWPVLEANILLPYPAGLEPSVEGYVFQYEYYFPALSAYDAAGDWTYTFSKQGGSVNSRFTDDGVRIGSFPVNGEIIIWATIAGRLRDDTGRPEPRGWCMPPRRLKLAAGQTVLNDAWQGAVVLDPLWMETKVLATFTPVDNAGGVKFMVECDYEEDGFWRVLPPGEYQVRFESGVQGSAGRGFEMRVSVRGEGRYFEIPPDVLAKLKESGLYDPGPPDDG